MQQDNYSGKKIEVNVVSGFTGLRSFFEQLAHYQRIVSITNFELKQLEKQSLTKTVDARFDLTAYYVSPSACRVRRRLRTTSLQRVERFRLRLPQPRNPRSKAWTTQESEDDDAS